jgi:hypothetical protein
MGPRCEYKDLDGSYMRKYSKMVDASFVLM